jgi:hypothetical protein
LSIGRPVISPLFKFHDAIPDEPVPQGQRHIDGFGGIVLGLLMEVDDEVSDAEPEVLLELLEVVAVVVVVVAEVCLLFQLLSLVEILI